MNKKTTKRRYEKKQKYILVSGVILEAETKNDLSKIYQDHTEKNPDLLVSVYKATELTPFLDFK